MPEILLILDYNLKLDLGLIQSFLCSYLLGNVLKEIAEPAGALIQASKFQLGDPTLSVLELWGAEYQESNAILISAHDQGVVQKIADRERCPVNFVGTITGDGRVRKVFGGARGWDRSGVWRMVENHKYDISSLSTCIMKNNCFWFHFVSFLFRLS